MPFNFNTKNKMKILRGDMIMSNAFLTGQDGGGMSDTKIKKYLNSTVGTDEELPLDLLLQYRQDLSDGKNIVEFTSSGTYNVLVPIWAKTVTITACAGGGGGAFQKVSSTLYAQGGGGGGAAIVDKVVMIADNLKNTSIKIVVGNGGKGGGYYLDESNSTYKYPAAGDGGTTNISAFNISLTGGKGGTSSAGGTAGGAGGGEGGYSSTNGTNGITGSGGKANNSYGGGGGSLGAGGDGAYFNSDDYGTLGKAGVRGGGGGAVGAKYAPNAGRYAGSGGTGYVKLVWA